MSEILIYFSSFSGVISQKKFVEKIVEHHKKLHFKDEIRADISKRFLKYFEIRAPKIVNFLQ